MDPNDSLSRIGKTELAGVHEPTLDTSKPALAVSRSGVIPNLLSAIFIEISFRSGGMARNSSPVHSPSEVGNTSGSGGGFMTSVKEPPPAINIMAAVLLTPTEIPNLAGHHLIGIADIHDANGLAWIHYRWAAVQQGHASDSITDIPGRYDFNAAAARTVAP